MPSKQQALAELRVQVANMLALQSEGSTFPKLSRAQGQVDGYMRALIDCGVATDRELLAIVSDVRRQAHGEPTGLVPAARVA